MDLEVVGRHALLFDDDDAAAFVNSPDALVPWTGDGGGGGEGLLIDRYDVRHLLHRIPSRKSGSGGRSLKSVSQDGVSRNELDRERFGDLRDGDGGKSDPETRELDLAVSGAYQAVPFSYNSDGLSDRKRFENGFDYPGFKPAFPLPESLLNSLPPSEKMHQIIARTALFVSKHGGQSEIVLRVKHGDNPTFGFLMPDNHLHAYFRYLVDNPGLLCNLTSSVEGQEQANKVHSGKNEPESVAGGALSLLGSMYGAGEDDEVAPIDSSINKDEASEHAADAVGNLVTQKSVDLGDKSDEPPEILKENKVSVGKNQPTIALHSAAFKIKEIVGTSSGGVSTGKSQICTSNSEKLVVEPPSSLKHAVDKIAEFIVRNGKEFEAILIEQDKVHKRFPFLLPSNLYHPYYLKVLQEAYEYKLHGKDLSDFRHSPRKSESPRKSRERKESSSHSQDPETQQEGMYHLDRKEKFKMVIGPLKKDANEVPPKTAKQPGLSTDAAAAIVMAATRGLSSPTKIDAPSKQSVLSADAVAAIIREATRGSKSPVKSDVPPRSSEADSGRSASLGDSRPSSSLGTLSVSLHSSLKFAHKSKLTAPTSADLCGADVQLAVEGCSKIRNPMLASVIAKSAALAAASEADSSEAYMTKEQKQKAERLKRAKMFAALIKSGADINAKISPALVDPDGTRATPSGSALSGPQSESTRREREGSSVPVDAFVSGEKYTDNDFVDPEGKHEQKKRFSSSSREHDGVVEPEEDDMRSRKKHRSKHSSHSEKDDTKQKKHHSSSKHEFDSSGDEHHPKKKSRSRHHHRHHHKHDCSSDDDHHHKHSRSHREKHHLGRKEEVMDESEELSRGRRKVSPGFANGALEAPTPSALDIQPSDSAEVSEDLRAKVRAMLLATL